MTTRKNSGPTTAEAFRAAPPAVHAPSERTARTIWELIEPRLKDVGGHHPRRLEDVAASVLKRVAPAERAQVELVAMQALAVAVDAVVLAGREERALFINDIFMSLAARWSPTYRRTPGRSIWTGEKSADTLIDARREMLEAGVDLDRLWLAVCHGINDLYTVKLIGGAGHAQGRRVALVEGEVLDAHERIIAEERDYRRPLGRNRILLADAPIPPLKIARWTVAERDYDIMNVGEPTKAVIEILQSARLFLDAAEVSKDVDRLRAQVRGHEYPKRLRDWRSSWAGQDRRDPEVSKTYQKDRAEFRRHFRDLRADYNKLLGRLRQVEAVAKQIDEHSEKIDEHGHLEIKTAYYKTRTRRFQPRHLWPTEVSSKEDAENAVVPDENVLFGDTENYETDFPTEQDAIDFAKLVAGDPRVVRVGNTIIVKRRPDEFKATTSPRGRWFRVRAQFEEDRWWETDELGADGHPVTWQDDYTGPRRPLIGLDASSSMYHLTAVALGWMDAEQLLERQDFKTLMASAIEELAKTGKIDAPDATPRQRRNAMGVLANYSYGSGLARMLAELRSDAAKYGKAWGDSKNLQAFLDEGRKINRAIEVVVRMREEYLGAARALAAAAEARSAYDGLTIYDPFDGTPSRWHRPITDKKVLRNGPVSLLTRVPVGKPNADGFYPANYNGREVPQRKRGKDGSWLDVPGKTRRVDTKGSVANLVVPGLIHSLDASYAAHVVLALRARGVRDIVIVNDCFLVPSDARPLLTFALEDAVRPWLEGLGPFYKTFEEYLAGDLTWGPVVRRWRTSWEARLEVCRRGALAWPVFRFKDEVTVSLVVENA